MCKFAAMLPRRCAVVNGAQAKRAQATGIGGHGIPATWWVNLSTAEDPRAGTLFESFRPLCLASRRPAPARRHIALPICDASGIAESTIGG